MSVASQFLFHQDWPADSHFFLFPTFLLITIIIIKFDSHTYRAGKTILNGNHVNHSEMMNKLKLCKNDFL